MTPNLHVLEYFSLRFWSSIENDEGEMKMTRYVLEVYPFTYHDNKFHPLDKTIRPFLELSEVFLSRLQSQPRH